MTTVAQLYRYPLKGHGREELAHTTLTAGQSMPWDRTWAVVHDAARTDGTEWAHCANFSTGSKAPALMAITAAFDSAHELLTLHHPDRPSLTFHPDRETSRFLEWVAPLVPENRAQPSAIFRLDGRGFTDTPYPSVSLCNYASLRAVSDAVGTPVSPHRWRGNVWFDTGSPWDELDWVGKEVAIGSVVLRIRERTERCRATTANPKTGERDIEMLRILKGWGHQDFGVYAEVIETGPVFIGDQVKVL